jgi:hypothetical protein
MVIEEQAKKQAIDYIEIQNYTNTQLPFDKHGFHEVNGTTNWYKEMIAGSYADKQDNEIKPFLNAFDTLCKNYPLLHMKEKITSIHRMKLFSFYYDGNFGYMEFHFSKQGCRLSYSERKKPDLFVFEVLNKEDLLNESLPSLFEVLTNKSRLRGIFTPPCYFFDLFMKGTKRMDGKESFLSAILLKSPLDKEQKRIYEALCERWSPEEVEMRSAVHFHKEEYPRYLEYGDTKLIEMKAFGTYILIDPNRQNFHGDTKQAVLAFKDKCLQDERKKLAQKEQEIEDIVATMF